MTFPTRSALGFASDSGSGFPASHVVTIGACSIGDLILVHMGICNHSISTSSMPAEWTKVTPPGEMSAGGGTENAVIFARVVTGTESWYNGGAGGNTTVTHTQAVACTWMVERVVGHNGVAGIEVAYLASAAASAAPNPPLLTPSWGARDTLWYVHWVGDLWTNWYLDPPTYTHIEYFRYPSIPEGVSQSLGYRQLNAASDDPGAFSTDPVSYLALTIAVQPFTPTGGGFAGEPGGGLW